MHSLGIDEPEVVSGIDDASHNVPMFSAEEEVCLPTVLKMAMICRIQNI